MECLHLELRVYLVELHHLSALTLRWVVQDVLEGVAGLDLLIGLKFNHSVDHLVLLNSVP